MAGIIAVYGLVVSVLIVGALGPDQPYSLYGGFIHLAAGLCTGLTGLAAGYAIGIVGDAVSQTMTDFDTRRRCGCVEGKTGTDNSFAGWSARHSTGLS